jgi:hypothetical protein
VLDAHSGDWDISRLLDGYEFREDVTANDGLLFPIDLC